MTIPTTHGRRVNGVEIIGPSEAAHDHPGALLSAAVASPDAPLRRLDLTARLALPAERYATLVHPTAVIPESASIGPGSILHAGVILTADIQLGLHVAVMPAVVLTHDDVVGDGVTFGAGARVAGGVTIERGAYIGSGAMVREGLTGARAPWSAWAPSSRARCRPARSGRAIPPARFAETRVGLGRGRAG